MNKEFDKRKLEILIEWNKNKIKECQLAIDELEEELRSSRYD